MNDITANEMRFMLLMLKSLKEEYNANNISVKLGMSAMGALKIAKRLEKENILISKERGKATFYSINLKNDYVRQYLKFLLEREAEQAEPYIKRWVNDIRKIKNADVAILFGSVLRKQKDANDIDILVITDRKRYARLSREIEEINSISDKKIHPMYQTREDFKENIKKGDLPILSAIKGIVAFGEETIIELIE